MPSATRWLGTTPVPPPSPHVALVLFDVGSPADADDCGPFLKRLLADIHVTQSPFGNEMQKLWALLAAPVYAPPLREALAAAGGRAPEPAALEALARAVAEKLASPSRRVSPYLAFRHAPPSLADALRRAQADGFTRIEAVWARPFPSHAGSESGRAELGLAGEDQPALDVAVLDRWESLPSVQACWASAAKGAFESLPETERRSAHVVYTLQALPIAGDVDPSLEAARAFASAVHQQAGIEAPHSVAYQRRTHPRAALEPDVEVEIRRLGRTGCRALAAVPIFAAIESLATRWELDVHLKAAAREAGIPHFARAPCPGSLPGFPAALAEAVQRHLEEMDRLRS